MRVRTIRDHDNGHGKSYHKSAKDKTEYVVADDREAKRLIKAGFVEAVPGKPKAE